MSGELSCSCLCGGVRFRLPRPDGPVMACHCRQCRKTSGHFAASFAAVEASVIWTARAGMAEFAMPSGAVRGFCRHCGSSLWFRSAGGDFAVEAGSVDGPTGMRLAAHLFTAERGDYYALDGGPVQFAGDGDVD